MCRMLWRALLVTYACYLLDLALPNCLPNCLIRLDIIMTWQRWGHTLLSEFGLVTCCSSRQQNITGEIIFCLYSLTSLQRPSTGDVLSLLLRSSICSNAAKPNWTWCRCWESSLTSIHQMVPPQSVFAIRSPFRMLAKSAIEDMRVAWS